MRNLSGPELTHYAGDAHREVLFAFLDFVSGALRVCDAERPYTWGGHSWLAMGDLGGISEIEESSDLGIRSFTLLLNGVEPSLLASALDRTDYKGRDVSLYVGVLDADDELIDTPKEITRGFMDVGSIMRQDGVGQIHMRCERESVRLTRKIGARISDQDHQSRHPGDKICSHMAAMINKDWMWGQERITPPSRGPAFNGGSNERAPFRQR